MQRPIGLLATSGLLAGFGIYAAVRTPTLMKDFRGLFAGFGAQVPPLTNWVLNAPNLWWIISMPALFVFVWIARHSQVTPSERRRMRRAVMACVVFAAAVYGLVVYALYTPLFKLGAAV